MHLQSLSWPEAWHNPRYKKALLFSGVFLVLVLIGLSFVLTYAEARSGFVIETNWLSFIPPADLSVFIFYSTYGFALLGLFIAFRNPVMALRLVQAYALLSFFRCLTLLAVPLDAHPEIIPLDDLLLRSTFYAGRPNLKDLFFSGHTATLVLFALLLPGKMWKIIFGTAAVGVGVMLAVQRVHYISDVVAAPLFAVLVWRLTRQPLLFRR